MSTILVKSLETQIVVGSQAGSLLFLVGHMAGQDAHEYSSVDFG